MTMKIFRRIITFTLAIINIIVVLAMTICAYSIYLSPEQYPNWSYLGMMLPACIAATLLFMLMWLIFKWKYTLISIAGIALCWNSIRDYCPINPFQGKPTGRTLKVLSYNVFSFGGKSLNEDNTQVVDYIAQSGADIVCLQEVNPLKRDYVRKRLEEVYPYIMVDDENEAQNAILSHYPILSSRIIDHDTKTASSCVYELLVDADTVTVINNHLESYQLDDDDKRMYKQILKNSAMMGEPVDEEQIIDMKESFWWLEGKLAKANSRRARQADLLAGEIEQLLRHRQYIIMCGDFNDSPVSYVHHTLTKHLTDAYTQAGNGPGWSYNRSAMYFRIDHILASERFNPYGAKVDKTVQESDHYPIFCTLEML